MNIRRQVFGLLALFAVLSLLLGDGARAAFLEPSGWTGPGIYSLLDPADDGPVGQDYRDITEMYYRYVSGIHYVLLFLEGPVADGGLHSTEYMINVDSIAGAGASQAESLYVAAGLSGIDEIVDAHYAAFGGPGLDGGFVSQHDHDYLGAGGNPPFDFTFNALMSVGGNWQREDAITGGLALEWSIPESLLNDCPDPPGHWTFYASAHTIGVATYDITAGLDIPCPAGPPPTVPEPGTFALMGVLGGMGLVVRLRKRKA